MNPIRTRIAPSPTGDDLHIGNAYTALINYVFAAKNNGKFVIRIEDTDRTRLVPGSEDRILKSLNWLGIDHNEGPDKGGPYNPYRQSERLPVYKKHAEHLIEKGHAFYCFCTPERLAEMRTAQEANHQPPMYDGLCKKIPAGEAKSRVLKGEKYVVRLSVPEEGVTTFTDLIRGEISFENKLIDDQVLLKSDGFPTYHLGVVVDDHIMEISHIIRGEEWISSTPKHILLYTFFGWDLPVYAHMPLLRNPDKSKLSKRKNPVWVSWYKKEGYLPEAVRNYLATLAWAYPGGNDIFSTEEMIGKFELKDIQTTAPIFDIEKLRWMNGEYLRRSKISDVRDKINEFFEKKYPEDLVEKVLPLLIERMKTLREFESLGGFFFSKPADTERIPDTKLTKLLSDALRTSEWNHEAMEKNIRSVAESAGIKAKELFMELRIAVTGKSVGPPLLESLEILGKEETLARIPV